MTLINIKITNTKGNVITIEIDDNKTVGELKDIYIKRINGSLSDLQIRFDGAILTNDKEKIIDEGIGNNDQLTSNDRSLGGKKCHYFIYLNNLFIFIK